MSGRDAQEARLSLLLKSAADHLASEDNGEITATIDQCRRQIEECRLGIEQKAIASLESGLGWQLWSIFGKSLDWDHLASNFKLGGKILTLVQKLYNTKYET